MRRWGYITVVLLVAAVAASVPFARAAGPVLPQYLPFIGWGSVFNQFATAFFLSRTMRSVRAPALLMLIAGFIVTPVFLVGYMATFPSQSSVLLGALWHHTFALFAIGYVLMLGMPELPSSERAARLIRVVAWPAAALSAIAVGAVTFANARLPLLVAGGDYSGIVRTGLAPSAGALITVAIVLLVYRTRLRGSLNFALAASLLALLLDVLLTMYAGHFYTYGWYIARACGLLAASLVFASLVEEAGRMGTTVHDTERKLHVVFDHVADAILTVDARDVIASANHAAALLFDIHENRLAGMPVTRIIPDYIVAMESIPQSTSVEVRGQRSDGSIFPLEIAASEAAEASMTIVIARDITARKRAEAALASARDQALETARLKAQFLATMSHEIRTPINAIVGTAELMQSTQMTDEQREYIETVNSSAESLLSVINDILDFSKLEAGKMELDSVPFSPLHIVETMAEILATQARRKGLSMVTYVAPDVPKAVAGDPNRLKQVLLNLMSNAVKFTDAGNVITRCTVEQRAGDNVILRFSVSDSGIGIDAATRARLFMPFSQADGSTSRRFGGTGLGLSIAKRLVGMMDGTIDVESVEGQGSTFYFTAKFAQLSDDQMPERAEGISGSSALIVDDDKISREILMQYLSSWGIAVDVAADAGEALALLAAADANQTEYNFAIIDYFMPEVDGIELGRRIHELREYRMMPLILVTAFDEAGRGKDAVDAGFAAYLRKPMRQSSLYDAIAVATMRKELPRHPLRPAPQVTRADSAARVLVAEDHPVNQRIALKQLERLGYSAVAVSDGEQAVTALENGDFDAVLMDCQMPGIDGFEATRLIRKRETQTGRHIPIIAMTANAMEGDRESCLAAGMDDYIAKPVQMSTLQTTLERWTMASAG